MPASPIRSRALTKRRSCSFRDYRPCRQPMDWFLQPSWVWSIPSFLDWPAKAIGLPPGTACEGVGDGGKSSSTRSPPRSRRRWHPTFLPSFSAA